MSQSSKTDGPVPDIFDSMPPEFHPWRWALALVVLCVLPVGLMALGVDFSARTAAQAGTVLASAVEPGMSHGNLTHALLEWTAVCVAAFVSLLCVAQFRFSGDPSLMVIGLSMTLAAALGAYHALTASGLLPAIAHNREFMPLTGMVIRLLNGTFLAVALGLCAFSRRMARWTRDLRLLTTACVACAVISFSVMRIYASSFAMPQSLFPNAVLKRPYDVYAMIPFVVCGVIVLPRYLKRFRTPFAYALILSIIPHVAAQLYLAFGAARLHDSSFNIAHGLKIVGYAVPLVGLLTGYATTYRVGQRADQVIQAAKSHLEHEVRVRDERLEAIEARAESLQEQVDVAAITIDEHGTIERFSDRASTMFGFAVQEALGMNVCELMPQPYRDEHDAYLKRYLATGRTTIIGIRRELVGRRRNGSQFPLEIGISETSVGGKRAFSAVLRDLTEKYEREARLRQLVRAVEAVTDGIIVTDCDGIIQYVNPAVEPMTGYTSAELIGNTPRILKSGTMPQAPYADMWRTILSGRCWSGDVYNRRKDGSLYECELTISPVRDPDGSIGGFVSVHRDVTVQRSALRQLEERGQQIREANEQLSKTQEMLEATVRSLSQSNDDLDEFAYIASHDLKEPLRGMYSYATFLVEDYSDQLDDTGRDMLQTLTRLCKNLESLIDSLLYFSRVGRAELNMKETNLADVVHEVLDSIHVRLEELGVEIRIPRPLPTVFCDGVRVGEIFRNLITNAMKYNDKPHKWIEIGFETSAVADVDEIHGHAGNKAGFVFHVRDNGMGIQDRNLESVFRIFKRLHGRDDHGGGTGMGLTIAKKLVQRHQGRIWVESEHGIGTTFYFTLGADSARDMYHRAHDGDHQRAAVETV